MRAAMRPGLSVLVLAAALCLHAFLPAARAQDTPPQFPTIADAVVAANLTSLAALVARTDLNLTDPTLQAIVLAPSNEAIAAFNASIRGRLNALSNDTIATVLLYHIIPTAEPFTVLNSTEIVLPTLLETTEPTLEGLKNITIKPVEETVVYAGGVAPGPIFNLTSPVTAARSTIYVIQDVLVPPIPSLSTSTFPLTVSDALAQPGSGVGILSQLVQASPNVSAVLSDPDQAITVFAPSNAAINSLLASLNLRLSELLSQTALLERVLLNHVVPFRPITTIDLTPNTTSIVDTASVGDALNITVTASEDVLVSGADNPTPAQVITPDIKAGKSVIHLINGVLLPAGVGAPTTPSPSPSPAYGGPVYPPTYGVYSPSPAYPPAYGVYSPPAAYPPTYGTYSPFPSPSYPPSIEPPAYGSYPPVPTYGSPSPVAVSPSPLATNRTVLTPGPAGASASTLTTSLLSVLMATVGMLMLWAA